MGMNNDIDIHYLNMHMQTHTLKTIYMCAYGIDKKSLYIIQC